MNKDQATFDPYIDTRSRKEKQSDIGGALMLAVGVAGFIAARKKIAITRGISKDIIGAGLGSEEKYSRYLAARPSKITSPKATSMRERILDRAKVMTDAFYDPVDAVERVKQVARDRTPTYLRDLARPLPSDAESYHIAVQYINKNLNHPSTVFPSWQSFNLKESSLFHKVTHGPRVVPFAPGTTLGMVGREGVPKVVGKNGAILINND